MPSDAEALSPHRRRDPRHRSGAGRGVSPEIARRSIRASRSCTPIWPTRSACSAATRSSPAELKAVAQTEPGPGLAVGLAAEDDMRHERYAAAVTRLAAAPGVRTSPRLWLSLVSALRLAGRADEALVEGVGAGRAISAGLRQRDAAGGAAVRASRDRCGAPARRRRVERGERRPALPAAVRCGLHAAAALQSARPGGGAARSPVAPASRCCAPSRRSSRASPARRGLIRGRIRGR